MLYPRAVSRVGAFFDIDHTVLEINSGRSWIAYMRRTGKMGLVELARSLGWLVQYRFGLLDFAAMARRVAAHYVGQHVTPLAQEVEEWFAREVAWSICREARERIADHRAQDHVPVLLTSATQFLTVPVARAVGVEHFLCTEIEVDGGVLTGRYIEPACYGPGKVARAEAFAAAHGIDLRRSFFYTDSYSDLPMLERVGEPRVVNPDPRLRRTAVERGWTIETWRAVARAAGASAPAGGA
jgi:HAD superfamily hydrolase (TIGR01490 family)